MERHRDRIQSWLTEHGLDGLEEFNRSLLAELESEPLQLCVLGERTASKEEFVVALGKVDGDHLPPPTSCFMSRQLSRMPSCESINCPATDPSSLNPGLAKMREVEGKPGARGPPGGVTRTPEKTLGPFILEKVKLSIDESLLIHPSMSELSDSILQEALARADGPEKPGKRLNLKVHSADETFQSSILNGGVVPGGDDVLFDAFLIAIGSRFIRQTDLELAKWCSAFHRRRSILVYTSNSSSNGMKRNEQEAEDPEHHSKVKRYYRQKLFKYKLSDVSLFIVDAHSQEHDYPDLIRILLKWDKRKAHRRKHAVVRLEKEAAAARLGEHGTPCRVAALLAGVVAGMPQTTPLGPVICDAALAALRYAWLPQSIGMPVEKPTLDAVSGMDKPTLLYIGAHVPCSLIYLVQCASSVMFQRVSSLPTVHSVVCGLTAGLGYVAIESILDQSVQAVKERAFHRINSSVGDCT